VELLSQLKGFSAANLWFEVCPRSIVGRISRITSCLVGFPTGLVPWIWPRRGQPCEYASSQFHYGGLVFFFDFAHLAWAARRAVFVRCSAVWFFTRFLPPFLPILARYSFTLSIAASLDDDSAAHANQLCKLLCP
jgi:hypothetical protein